MKFIKMLTLGIAVCSAISTQALNVENLRTEHLKNPTGIDIESPIFSWNLSSEKRGVLQTTYQITIASDKNMSNVVWDSGIINSSESASVKAIGFTPQPSTRYYWSVSVKDNTGESASSTEVASFETGLMGTGWSNAKWINATVTPSSSTDSDKPFNPAEIKNYTVDADFEIERIAAGIIWGAVDHNNYYMWQFNTERSPSKFRPHRWSGGSAACLDEIDVNLEPNKVYHMHIEVTDDGKTANTYLDGKLIDSRTGSFPYGDMGVRACMAETATRYAEIAYYDDFRVSSEGKTLFEDHFENRDNFDNGTIVNKQLRVEGVRYAWQQNFQPDESIKNYTVEGKFNIDQVAAGICFAGIDNSHYYMWQFNIEKDEPMFRPHRWNGGASCLAEIPLKNKVSLTQGREYNLRIEITNDGKKASTYLNNVLIDERNGEFAYGRIGIRADVGEKATRTYERSFYDNFETRDDNDNLLFSENFDNPGAIQFSDGDAIDGRLRVGSYSDVYAWAVDNSTLDPDLHYTIEADMTLLRDNAALIFNWAGSVNYHMWAINTVNHPNPCIRRHVYAGSTSPSYSDTEFTNFTKADLLNKEHHVKIEIQGNLITTSIDDYVVDTFKDTSGTLKLRKIGFRSNTGGNENERAYWDNVKVTVYNPDGTKSILMDEDFEGDSNEFDDAEIALVGNDHKLYMYSRNGETRILENSSNGTPIFRKQFNLASKVVSAKLYTSALGNYNVFINGERVGTTNEDGSVVYDELMPGWTDYRKTVFYMTHDVTKLLNEGDNAIGAQLSSGWWGGDIAHGVYGAPELAFIGKLVVDLSDGSTVTIVSDNSWKISMNGPIKRGDIYHGETYDARRADGWATPGYDDSEWDKASIDNQFKGEIKAYEGPAVRIRENLTLYPKTITIYEGVKSTGTTYGEINVVSTTGNQAFNLKKGQTAIFDLGQNFAGWVHFSVKGNSGTIINMRFSEMLNDKGDASRGDDGPGGSLYTINLRNAKCLLKYIMNGDEAGEEYHPSTTFYGFRYCEITATADITVNSLIGQVVGSETEEGSSLKVDHDAVNQLSSNIIWGQRSNFLSVPTDCPQRDERLGWTADTHVFSMAASYNADVQAFYRKWMGDMRDSQREDGAYPDVAPYCWVGHGQAAWGDAGVILPWNVYVMYGDKSIIAENYESMERYMDYVANQKGDGYLYNGAGTNYGDWVSFENTDRRYVSVSYYAYMADLMSRMSKVLSENDNDIYAQKAAKYETLFNNIKEEFAKRYLNNGVLKIQSQCAYLLALRYNLLPDEKAVETAKASLRNKIANNGYKLSTGFVGTAVLNQTLSEFGLDDLAYTLLLQRQCPSWLYSVDQGATTIWERWDAYTKERGFHSDITMNSFNHYANGAVGEWMYSNMAGIAPDKENPGFSHILLQPTPDNRTDLHSQARITTVDAKFASPYGKIESSWTRSDNGSITYNVTIPANTTATVYYPLAKDQTDVYEGSVKASDAEGVEYVETVNGKAIFNIGSGSYIFSPDGTSGIENVTEKDHSLSIYPNPATDIVTIATDENIEEVTLYDLSGVGYPVKLDVNKIDVTPLFSGYYIAVIKTDNGSHTVRLAKK